MATCLTDAPNAFVYVCPWCPIVVVDAGDEGPAVALFERHLDRHIEAGDHDQAGAA